MTAIADAAFQAIPAILRDRVSGVVIQVDEFPSADIERDMELHSPYDLLGLYQGVPLRDKSILDVAHDVDLIFLYRRPILDYWCETGEDLEHVIRHVLIHEIGHHFGLSDADMEAIEQEDK